MANTREVMGEQACLDALVADTLTTFEDDDITKIGKYRFIGRKALERVDLPNATFIGERAFQSCENLDTVNCPKTSGIGEYSFASCKNLRYVYIDNTTVINTGAFSSDGSLVSIRCTPTQISGDAFKYSSYIKSDLIDMSNVTTIGSSAFLSSGIDKLVLPNATNVQSIGTSQNLSVVDMSKQKALSNRFTNNYSLLHLVLRNDEYLIIPSISKCPLTSIGWIYVPEELVSIYQEKNTNYASRIVSISEYPKAPSDETISDTWADIAASNSYEEDYSIGDIKYMRIGETLLAMQLVAFNTDELASGGNARMTWISRDIFMQEKFAPTQDEFGWNISIIRNNLREKIYPLIESDVRNAIKPVKKYSVGTTPHDETVWIPSYDEMFSSSPQYGCSYVSYFDSAGKRAKSLGVAGDNSSWFTRTRQGASVYSITSTGAGSTSYPTATSGVVIGFCI